jgi:hypothetical protein
MPCTCKKERAYIGIEWSALLVEEAKYPENSGLAASHWHIFHTKLYNMHLETG